MGTAGAIRAPKDSREWMKVPGVVPKILIICSVYSKMLLGDAKETHGTHRRAAASTLRCPRDGGGKIAFVFPIRRHTGSGVWTVSTAATGNVRMTECSLIDIASGATCLCSRGRLCHIMAMLLVIDSAKQ